MEIVFGLLSGIVTSLGMGGGTILILLLNLFSDYDMHIIQGTNLIFFIPTAICASIMNRKFIDFKMAKSIIFSGIIGGIIGTKLTFKFNPENIKKYFGVLLLGIAVYEIFVIFLQYKKSIRNNTNIKKGKEN